MALEISVAFPPSRAAIDHAVMAEKLGYKRAWFYDSPALYPDVWVVPGRCWRAPRPSMRRMQVRPVCGCMGVSSIVLNEMGKYDSIG